MNAWKVILATLVIFAAGIVTGALYFGHGHDDLLPSSSATAAAWTNSPSAGNQPTMSPPGPLLPMLRKDFLTKLDSAVQLTDVQREHIEKILADGQEHTTALWNEIAPQIHQECHNTKERIRAELTADQKDRFEAMIKREKKLRQEAEAAATNSLSSATP